jgi:hypothetical protein
MPPTIKPVIEPTVPIVVFGGDGGRMGNGFGGGLGMPPGRNWAFEFVSGTTSMIANVRMLA